MAFVGFNQVQQRHLLVEFKNQFFEKIPEIFKKKGRFVAELYFYYLQPSYYADDETIDQYEQLLRRVKIDTPDNSHLIRLIQEALHDIRLAKKGKAMSLEYLQKAEKI
jgi:hypothetical protein